MNVRMRRALILAAALVPATVAIGQVETRTAAAVVHSTRMVTIKGYNFHAATVTVKMGTTVAWTNKEAAVHTVSIDPGSPGKLESGDIRQGKTYRHRFTALGTFHYHCAYHPFMHGTVKVTR